jgi:hypothetical protein
MTLSIKNAAASALTIAVLLMMPISSTMAQSGRDAEPAIPEYSGTPGADSPQLIDDATLQHTAKAFVRVSQIVKSEQRVLSSANNDTAKMKVAQQAESQKVAAVKAEGLQPQQYNQVLQLVQTDSNLQQKFFSYLGGEGASAPPTNNL